MTRPLYGHADLSALSKSQLSGKVAGVYAFWRGEELYYVGMSGNLASRLTSHYSGGRSGDQFCIYVQDHTLLPDFTPETLTAIANRTLRLDHLVRDYVRAHLKFRLTLTSDTNAAKALEKEALDGALGVKPVLNEWARG